MPEDSVHQGKERIGDSVASAPLFSVTPPHGDQGQGRCSKVQGKDSTSVSASVGPEGNPTPQPLRTSAGFCAIEPTLSWRIRRFASSPLMIAFGCSRSPAFHASSVGVDDDSRKIGYSRGPTRRRCVRQFMETKKTPRFGRIHRMGWGVHRMGLGGLAYRCLIR